MHPELRLQKKSGEKTWIQLSVSPVIDGELLTGFTGTLTDIAKNKKIESELREREFLYQSVIEASPDVITITDLEGTVLFSSPKSKELFRSDTTEAFIGRPLLDFIDPSDHPRAIHGITNMMHGNLLGSEVYIGRRCDGTSFDIEVNGEFVRDENGLPLKMVFVTRDISKRGRPKRHCGTARKG